MSNVQDEHQLSLLHERQSTNATEEKRFPSINTKFFQSKEETPSNLRLYIYLSIYLYMPCIALIPYKCCWCIYLAFCCLHNKASHQWQHRASSQKSFHSVDGSAAHRGSLFSEREAVTKCWRENGNLKNRSNSGWLKFNPLTRVDDCLPLVELALVWLTVEVTTLDVPERGQVMKTRCGVTDLVSLSLSQTILPSVPRTTEQGTMLFECFCTFFFFLNKHRKHLSLKHRTSRQAAGKFRHYKGLLE